MIFLRFFKNYIPIMHEKSRILMKQISKKKGTRLGSTREVMHKHFTAKGRGVRS